MNNRLDVFILLSFRLPPGRGDSYRIPVSDETGTTKDCGAVGGPGVSTIDLKQKTGWSGEKRIVLRLHPATNHGEIVKPF
jgi:hypothetical protein